MKVLNIVAILSATVASAAVGFFLRHLFSNVPPGLVFVIFGCGILLTVTIQLVKGRYLGSSVKTVRIALEEKQLEEAREGLIVFLPLYRRFGIQGAPSPGQPYPEDVQKAILQEDYNGLGFANDGATNFGHATLAIKTHLSKLKYCWLVTTRSLKTGQNSKDFVPVYTRFLKENVTGDGVTFLTPTPIDTDDESGVAPQVSDLVQRIFRQARREYGLKPRRMVMDVTPGTKSMTVGAVLGALPKERDIQIIVARYEGDVPRDPFPVILKFEPKLIVE